MEFLLRDSEGPRPEREETLAQYRAIDPSGRPLFASLFADALAAGRDPRRWDQRALLKDVLSREDANYWKSAQVTEIEKDLLSLATMSGGIDLRADCLPGTVEEKLRLFSPEKYRVISGKSARERLAPLEPDVLGEFFVLEHLAPPHVRNIERTASVRDLALQIDDLRIFYFPGRCAQDFPDHNTLTALAGCPKTASPAIQRLWATCAPNLVAIWARLGRREIAQEFYRSFSNVVLPQLNNLDLAFLMAAATYHLSIESTFTEVPTLQTNIRAITEAHPNEIGLRVYQAGVTGGLAVAHLRAGNAVEAWAMLDEVAELAREYPDQIRAVHARISSVFVKGLTFLLKILISLSWPMIDAARSAMITPTT